MSDLVNELLKADTKKVFELETGVFKSKSLAKLLGKTEPVDVTIRELPPRRKAKLMNQALDKNGNTDYELAYEANLKVIVEGVVDPPLKNAELQDAYGCKMAIDLVERLFKSEVGELSEAILELGIVEDADYETIKN